MCTSAALRKLARFLEDCEGEGAVSDVGLAEAAAPDGTAAVTAAVELTLSTSGSADVGLVAASAGEDGTLGLEFESVEAVVPATGEDVAVDVASATFEGGSVAVTLSASVPIGADGGPAAAPTPSGDEADRPAGTAVEPAAPDAGGDPPDADVPPFRNPDLLAEVYGSCETFAEMADALEMDVSAETVRRYMVDYDIHQPGSYDTGESGDAVADSESTSASDAGGALESPVVRTDGIGLPEDVTVEGLVAAVERSATVHEVTRELGVDRKAAVAVLRELDLLDFVAGRLAAETDRDADREEILDRLRAASATR